MTASLIEKEIESEPLDLHCHAYSNSRQYLDEMLAHELENGDVIEFAKNCMAAYRRAMLHALQSIDAPGEVIMEVLG